MNNHEKYEDVLEAIITETQCVSMIGDDPDADQGTIDALVEFAQELAEGPTAERDAEIAEALPVPYQKKVPARAQLDGDMLTIPRCVIATASRGNGGEWVTSTRGPRMGREKSGCVVGVHEELVIPGVVEIIRVVILWRRVK